MSSFLEIILENISEITLQIQQNRNLEDILQDAITSARKLLNLDRILIYQFLSTQDAVVAFETINSKLLPILGQQIPRFCLEEIGADCPGQLTVIADTQANSFPRACSEFLKDLQVRASLSVPLLSSQESWGFLMAHHCFRPHEWHSLEVQYLQQLALLLGLAIQQANLRQSQHCIGVELQQCNIATLQQSESRYRLMTELTSDYIYRLQVDSNGEISGAMVADQFTAMTGFSLDEMKEITDWHRLIYPEDLPKTCQFLQSVLASKQPDSIEIRFLTKQNGALWVLLFARPEFDQTGERIIAIEGAVQNINDRKLAEVALREQQQFTEEIAESTLAILYVYDLVEQRNVYCNRQIETVLGYSPEEIQAMGDAVFPQLIHPDDFPKVIENQLYLVTLQDHEFVEIEYRMLHKSGDYRWLLSRGRILNRTLEGKARQIVGVAIDITDFKETQSALHQQADRERLLSAIVQHIRQTLNLDQILQTTVMEVQQLLQTDRVLIYRFNPDWSGMVTAESGAEGWASLLGMQIKDTYFVENQGQTYRQRYIKATDDIYTANLEPCHIEFLEQIQVRAKLVVPIFQNGKLWGLLVAHHCRGPRHWESWEVALQEQLATHIEIAIQQSELYQQVQTLNIELELQVHERTAQLQQALDFEALLKRITDRVRDSLDERQILQAGVEELTQGLALIACDTGIYDAEQTHSTIAYEFTHALTAAQGRTLEIATAPHPEVYPYMFSGQICHFCDISPDPLRPDQWGLSILAVPIIDDGGVLGDIWLFKQSHQIFNEQEVRLARQVANQCAIALRQSRLYQAAQFQVQELERLSQLKDDFLSTVSHELRTPMSNIKMATQMLEISLDKLNILTDEDAPISRYFHVLQEEGRREISLINDLLDLTRLEAEIEPLSFTMIELQCYIPHLAESFIEQTHQQQQQLIFQIPEDLPPLTTDLNYLERILSELLQNACKYTPAGERITVAARTQPAFLEIRVSNSGAEIPLIERDRIFDKFYRIPNNDPWKHGGTGLGLALVKKLTERLSCNIRVESGAGETTFILEFAISSSSLQKR